MPEQLVRRTEGCRVGNDLAQYRRWEAAGADQILLLRGAKTKEQTLEVIRLIGEHVIPTLDTEAVCSAVASGLVRIATT